MGIAIIFAMLSPPTSIIFFIFASPNPSTSSALKKPAIFFSFTVSSSSIFFNIISTRVSFQTYFSFGINAVSAGVIISCIFGITSPERIILITAPRPILLSSINFALNPVA